MVDRQTTGICTQSHTIPANAVTISYSSEYGTAPDSKTVTSGYELTTGDLPTLEAEGHVFSYWAIDSVEVEVGTVITEDTELTAVWAS